MSCYENSKCFIKFYVRRRFCKCRLAVVRPPLDWSHLLLRVIQKQKIKYSKGKPLQSSGSGLNEEVTWFR